MRTFRILRHLEIVKYVQHMLPGGRHVQQWTHKAKMADISVLLTCDTEPIAAFVLRMCDQSAARTASLTKLNALFFLPSVFLLWLAKHVWLLKWLLHSSHGILGPADIQGGRTIQSLHVCSQVCSAGYVQPLLQPSQNVSFGHRHCQVSNDTLPRKIRD